MQLKPQKQKQSLILENDYVTWTPRIVYMWDSVLLICYELVRRKILCRLKRFISRELLMVVTGRYLL